MGRDQLNIVVSRLAEHFLAMRQQNENRVLEKGHEVYGCGQRTKEGRTLGWREIKKVDALTEVVDAWPDPRAMLGAGMYPRFPATDDC